MSETISCATFVLAQNARSTSHVVPQLLLTLLLQCGTTPGAPLRTAVALLLQCGTTTGNPNPNIDA